MLYNQNTQWLDQREKINWKSWYPKRGEIFTCDLGWNIDSEQSSKRPTLIIQNDMGNQHSSTLVIIPISKANKFSTKIHVFLEKELGFLQDSYAYVEQIRCVSKRRFFYNSGIPHKITTLPESIMNLIQNALEFELGFQPLMFDENEAFKLIDHIRNLQNNIKVKKSNNLIDLLNEKMSELIIYCGKYRKNHKLVIAEYERINNYAYEAI